MVNDRAAKRQIKRTELERLENEMVRGKSSASAKKRPSAAKDRMMKGARNACGPRNQRGDWRWGGA
ncbi:MAG TPA: hypothetical protein DCG48_01755 [Rhodospirillaceae bacterium]|nr:hypothetical protein [Rhodospirillaceae bacterium]|tara:strand:- start:235 stop:432 length:198 start_codon:yes stop_codon:yes gene_type:complete